MPSQTLEALLCLDIHLLYEYISLSRFTSNSMYQYADLGLIWEFYKKYRIDLNATTGFYFSL